MGKMKLDPATFERWAQYRHFEVLTPCAYCKHRSEIGYYCDAFPSGSGIPQEILMGRESHIKPVPGDRGIQFEPRFTEQETMAQCYERAVLEQQGNQLRMYTIYYYLEEQRKGRVPRRTDKLNLSDGQYAAWLYDDGIASGWLVREADKGG